MKGKKKTFEAFKKKYQKELDKIPIHDAYHDQIMHVICTAWYDGLDEGLNRAVTILEGMNGKR